MIPYRTFLPRRAWLLSAALLASWTLTARAANDFNNDGLDDVWQNLYDAWSLSLSGDEDNDGASNEEESLAGTDPRSPSQILRVQNMVVQGGNILVTVPSQSGKKYQLQGSTAPSGGVWGNVGAAQTGTGGELTFSAPISALNSFLQVAVTDQDGDSDGVSDWAEDKTGTTTGFANSPTNASGGAGSDVDTLRSVFSLTATPVAGADAAFEVADRTADTPASAPAKVALVRTFGTMPLAVAVAGGNGAPSSTKANAAAGDYSIVGLSNGKINIPLGAAVPGNPLEVTVMPVPDAANEVPEYLAVKFGGNGAPLSARATVRIADARPDLEGNRRLFVAYLGREAGATTTASGIATALVEGDNASAVINLSFSNLSSEQNTAYLRIENDLDLLNVGLGQVSDKQWEIKAGQTRITDQAMLDALENGDLYIDITTALYESGEIKGYFNRASGSTEFNEPEAPPTLGSADWQNPTGEALEREIWRFLSHSTYGGTQALYDEVHAKVQAAIAGGGTYLDGLSNWLDEQMNPALTPSVNLMKLVMAADNEEFALRGNKPITYNSDPQLNGAAYNVTYDAAGMPIISQTADTNRIGNNYPQSGPNRRREWWTMVLQCRDQVRQRMTLALSEILVISEADQTVLDRHYGCANYWDMLATGAFGKYRELLEEVTYSPMMGVYLSHIGNRGVYQPTPGLVVSPDENYAREIMQLFSIGLVLRHPDGSLVLSQEGLPIPTYDQSDITELARVMTGWSHGARNSIGYVSQWNGTSATWNHQSAQRVGGTILYNDASPLALSSGTTTRWFGRDNGHLFFPAPWINRMKLVGRLGTTVYHDFNQYVDPVTLSPVSGVSKRLLAGKHGQFEIPMRTPPASQGWSNDQQWHEQAELDMEEAHNALAGDPNAASYGAGTQASPGHQNTPVNISRWLIQRLVTSNPSAGYIYRVSSAYRATNGNLGAVLKAILLDYEARSLQLADSSVSHGKVKEPLVQFAATLRALRAFSGAPVSILRDNPPSFSATDTPMVGGYSSGEFGNFSTHNANPPSLPDGWLPGPFRFRLNDLTSSIGQSPQRAPSVFNWFLPDYVVPGPMAQAGLYAPELQISTESNEVAKANFFYNYTWSSLVGMTTQPGSDSAVSDFLLNNNNATGAALFTINGSLNSTLTFTTANWNTDQTVTITAINNSLLSSLSNGLLRFNISGGGYDGVVQAPEQVVINDDEKINEGILATHTSFSTWVQEGGNTDTVLVRLSAPPPVGATVSVAVSANAGQASVSPTPLTFNSSNWNTDQVVTVTAVQDILSETAGTANDTLTFTASSAASNYQGLQTTLPVNVIDNDDGASSFGVIITETGGGTAVDEATGSDTYQVRLAKAPSVGATVTVTVTANGSLQLGASGSATTQSLTFNSTNFGTNQTVTVRANNDGTAEAGYPANPLHIGSIRHTIASNSGGYVTTLPIQTLGVPITDNDERIIMAHTGGETRVGENGLSDTITVRLRTAPTVDVVVSLGSNSVICQPAFLTFTPLNYATAQTVTVTGVDDAVKEGLQSAWTGGIITATATATSTLTSGSVSGLTITNPGAGYTSTPTVSFGGAPTGGVTATGLAHISPSGTLTGITITNPGSGYVSAPSVTVQAPPQGGGVIIASGTSLNVLDGNYNNYWSATHSALNVTILDNDNAAVLINQTGGSTTVAEGGATDTYTLVLAQQPTADVVVRVGPALNTSVPPTGQVTTDVASVTFTAANWNIPQTVTITAVDDNSTEVDHSTLIYHTVQSSDGAYAGVPMTPLSVTITDNDFLGITLSHLDGYTALLEGGPALTGSVTSGVIYAADDFRVRLPLAPTANVTVTLEADSSQVTLSTNTLTFTAANGTTDQTLRATVVDDGVTEGPHTTVVRFRLSSTDIRYSGAAVQSLEIPIYDNDQPGILVGDTGGGTTITIPSGPTGGVTTPTEGGTDTVLVRLTKAPASASVTIDFTSSSPADMTVLPASMTFTTANWSSTQTLTLTAVADMVPEGREPVTVTATVRAGSDATYLAAPAVAVPVWITEQMRRNQSLVVIPTGGTHYVVEGGKTDTALFYLASRPTTSVTVSIDANSQLDFDKSIFTFTPADWNVPQQVVVSAVNDLTVENNHTSNIQWRCNNPNGVLVPGDPLYTNINPTTSFNIVDNDGRGVIVEESGGDTRTVEGGAGGTNVDTYTVRLASAPTGNVVISAASSNTSNGQTVSPAQMTFTTANWSTPQTVTVTAANDTAVEAFVTGAIPLPNTHVSGAIAHAIVTAGGVTTDTSGYASLTGLQSVTNYITDNDNRIITAHTGIDTRVQEDGSVSDTYTVVLRSPPTAPVNVILGVTANQGITVNPTNLSFTTTNWSTPQTVTVNGNFSAATPTRIHTSSIVHTSSSTDSNFNVQTTQDIQVNIVTKDTPQIVVYESSSTTVLTEGGATDTYQMALSQEPTADVTVTIAPDSQISIVGPTTLTFTQANWSMLQTVLVRAVDDTAVESAGHLGMITHSAASTDPVFNGIAMASVPCFIADNDFPAVRVVPTGGSTLLSEANLGLTDTYSVFLTRQPTSDVTVTIVPGTQVNVVSPGTTLTFTNSNWATPQVVTLSAAQDAVAEGTHTTSVTHTCASADPTYNGLGVPHVLASITDNDGSQLVVTHSGGNTTVTEGGAPDTFTIRLSQPPTGNVTVTLVPPVYIVPVPPYAKQVGYYTSDLGGSNQQRDRIVMDYAEIIQLYRETFYDTLEVVYGTGNIPANPAELEVQKAHWAATQAIIDKMDMWWCGGSLKAKFPNLVAPYETPPQPLAQTTPRQAIMECIYYINGGSQNLGTKRYAPEITFNPKAPPVGTFHDEVRDRARWSGYLMSTVMPAFVSH